MCFYQELTAGERVDAQLLVFRGGLLDLKLRIEGPTKKVLFDKLIFSNKDSDGNVLENNELAKKGHVVVGDLSGTYSVCLDNRIAKYTAKASARQ